MRGDTEVRRRIKALDGAPPGTTTDSLVNDLARVINVMQEVNSSWWQVEYGSNEPPAISPGVADEIVHTSKALARIADAVPCLATGPLAFNAQAWTSAGGGSRMGLSSHRQTELVERHFTPVPPARPQTKPRVGGLFTCTVVPSTTTTMWLMYQAPFGGHNTLFPKPWHTYLAEVKKGARIFEARSAAEWSRLVSQYALEQKGLLYPDWVRMANDLDAVHVTVPTIVATQGLRLATPIGTIAEAYWDVEQTFWLNWCFERVQALATGDE